MEPGYKYEGEYNDRYQRNGVGIATFNNGDRYEGTYENGKRNGFGVYTFANGSEYNGEWRNGKKHGLGVFTYLDKSHFDGEWCDDLRHGYGKYFYNNGDYYEGEWSNHQRHGKGKYVYAVSNLLYSGTWHEGKRTGDGVVSRIGECIILSISNKPTSTGDKSFEATKPPSPVSSQDFTKIKFQYHMFHSGADFQCTTSSTSKIANIPKEKKEEVFLQIIDSTTFAKTGFNYHLFHSKSPFGQFNIASEAKMFEEKIVEKEVSSSTLNPSIHKDDPIVESEHLSKSATSAAGEDSITHSIHEADEKSTSVNLK